MTDEEWAEVRARAVHPFGVNLPNHFVSLRDREALLAGVDRLVAENRDLWALLVRPFGPAVAISGGIGVGMTYDVELPTTKP